MPPAADHPTDAVLLFPGSAPSAPSLQEALRGLGLRVQTHEDAPRAREAFASTRPVLALLDAQDQPEACLSLCAHLRRQAGEGTLCILVLGSPGDRSWIPRALQAGATDAWPGLPDPLLLRHRLRQHLARVGLPSSAHAPAPAHAVGASAPGSERRRAGDGRGAFHQALVAALDEAQQAGHRLAVLLMDLDRLPQIRESLGAAAGEELLRSLAGRLQGRLAVVTDGVPPAGTLCARLRGNEFAVLLPRLEHVQDAAKVARQLLEVMEEPVPVDGQQVSLTASIGIALHPEDHSDADLLLRAAAAALSHGREEGRQGFQFCSAALNTTVFERLTLETSLRRALEREEFRLHYQPRMDVATGRVTGCETLIRWQHPDLGLVGPSQFIPVAEETGLILPIGQWALQAACRQLRDWREQGHTALTVAVNLSAAQFRDPHLHDQVAAALAGTGLPAGALELELTESMLMTAVDAAIPTLQRLKDLGCSLAVDDFGTGYSSLSYLKRLPIDCLKVDQSFVRDLATDAEDRSIATAILRLARSLGLRVVAEGVATQEQWEVLRRLSCDEIQGYWFSPPLPDTELPAFLARADRDAPEG